MCMCLYFILFRITFPVQTVKGKKRKAGADDESKEEDRVLKVEPHVPLNRGPYPYNQPKRWEGFGLRTES